MSYWPRLAAAYAAVAVVLSLAFPVVFVAATSVALHPLNPRLVTIADVHGDMDNFRSILMEAQLVDCDGNWVGEDATVIQMGDVCDRGPSSHTVIEYIDEVLIPQAAAAGGEFVQLMGNHELLNFKGDHRFTMPSAIKAFGGLRQWLHAFSIHGNYGRRNAKLPVIVVRRGTAFVHAGLLPSDAAMGVDALNRKMQAVVSAEAWSDPFIDIHGPAWTREQVYAAMRNKDDCDLVQKSLAVLSKTETDAGRPPVGRLVVGHTIQPNGAVSILCGGTFIATDISSSQYMDNGGHLGFVEFRRVMNVGPQGKLLPFTDEASGRVLSDDEALDRQIRSVKPGALQIQGLPTYPTIPWKRHPKRQPEPPRWTDEHHRADTNNRDFFRHNNDNNSDTNRTGGGGEGFLGDNLRLKSLLSRFLSGKNVKNASDALADDVGTHASNAKGRGGVIKEDRLRLVEVLLLAIAVTGALLVAGGRCRPVIIWWRRRNKPARASI